MNGGASAPTLSTTDTLYVTVHYPFPRSRGKAEMRVPLTQPLPPRPRHPAPPMPP